MRHRIIRALGLGVLLLSLVAPPATANSMPLEPIQAASAPAAMPALSAAQKPLPPPADKHSVLGETDPGGDQPATYIVQLSSPPLASYAGNKPGLAPTSPRTRGESRLDMASTASAHYMSFLAVEQTAAQAAIEQALGRPVEVKFTYAVAYNGLAIVVSPQEAVTVAGLPGVVRVERDALQQLHTDVGPTWIGADKIWLTPAPGFPNGYKGEGVVVGVIDSGINFASLSFAGIGADQYVIQNPRGRYYGVCDPADPKYDATFVCNSKLIGAWDFADGTEPPDGPRDNHGHGSHTASTAAGNFVWPATGQAPTLVINANISGVAPHANLIAYDACGLTSCATSALIAAINQAAADGVDVINYSIGSNSADPWQRSDALAMLGALDAGVAVAVSAGNSGPGAATVGSPANAPWVTAVGASTHDRAYATGLSALAGGATPPPDDIYGVAVTAGMAAPAPIIYAGSASLGALADPQCTKAFPAGSLAGKIVVCDPGTVGRGAKGYNVLAGGAAGVVLIAPASSGETLPVDAHALPAAYIRAADGERLKNWLVAGADHTARINGVQADYAAANADHVVGFSSRGPDATVPDVLKPDVTAPGVGIYAAFKLPEQYAVINGTSMASPHTAGALALLAGLHPTWTPAELKAALMLAANPAVTKQTWAEPADPFDRGAGRIDLPGAAGVGFVLDESAYDFQQADPALGGDPTTLNLPSLANQACVGICTWTRTLKNVDDVAKTYNVVGSAPVSLTLTVAPAVFTLPPFGTQVVTITADVRAAAFDAWVFGQVDFARVDAPGASHFPVAIFTRAGAAPNGLESIEFETRRSQGSYTVPGLRAVTSPNLARHLYLGDTNVIAGEVAPDPAHGDPFAPGTQGVYTTFVSIDDPTTVVLEVEITDATAQDLDLFVGYDASGSGQPTRADIKCQSTGTTALEFCQIMAPQPGRYWILVYNFAGSGAAVDQFTLETTIVARSNENPRFTVTGPAAATQGDPFAVEIHWDFPSLTAGDVIRGRLELGTSSASPTDIAALAVTVERVADDVTVLASPQRDSPDGEFALPGDILTYWLGVTPEPAAPGPVTYTLTVDVPSELEVLPESIRAHAANGSTLPVEPQRAGTQLIFTAPNLATQPRYVMSSNDPQDSHYSEFCSTPEGGYVDLRAAGIPLLPQVSGAGKAYSVRALLASRNRYEFWGRMHGDLFFTTGALLSVTGYDPQLATGAPAPIPTAALPNNLIAPYWGNWQVDADPATGAGVRLANRDGYTVVDYTGLHAPGVADSSFAVQAWVADSTNTSPYRQRIIFAYDQITGTLPAGIVGLENATGAEGFAYTNAVHNGLVVCYDWLDQQHGFSYQARVRDQVAPDKTLLTWVQSTLSAPGFDAAATGYPVFAAGVNLEIAQSGPTRNLPGQPLTYTVVVTNTGKAATSDVWVSSLVPYGVDHISGGAFADGWVDWTLPVVDAGAVQTLTYSVALRPIVTSTVTGAVSGASVNIIGGEVAPPGAWPWQVALVQAAKADAYDGQFCGGSLIATDWVVTAAHCVVNSRGETKAPGTIDVVVGRHNLKSAEGQRLPVGEVRVHPGYSVITDDNDIALLRLTRPAELNATVQTIGLLSADAAADLLQPGQPAVVTGWGNTSITGTVYPADLMQVEVPLVAQEICQFNYAALGDSITDNMLCAGLPAGGKDSCQGDSGGPLVVRADEDQPWQLAGVVSWGAGCARPMLPGVYARVSNYGEWIADEQHTVTLRTVMTGDSSGLPGHSARINAPLRTLFKAYTVLLPLVTRQ